MKKKTVKKLKLSKDTLRNLLDREDLGKAVAGNKQSDSDWAVPTGCRSCQYC